MVTASRLSHVVRSPTMRVRFFALALLALAGCGEPKEAVTRQPCSVRGWIYDVKGAKQAETYEQEIARRSTLFQSTSLWVENAQYASGGIAENGAFVVLDVPPVNTIIGFNAPGAETGRLVLQNVPGNADVLIPDVILENGGATVRDPGKIVVRLPTSIDKPRPTGQFAVVAGHRVPVIETPYSAMMDRRDYPDPGGFRPVATVK